MQSVTNIFHHVQIRSVKQKQFHVHVQYVHVQLMFHTRDINITVSTDDNGYWHNKGHFKAMDVCDNCLTKMSCWWCLSQILADDRSCQDSLNNEFRFLWSGVKQILNHT